MFLFSSKKEGEIVLLLDVQSSVVIGSLVHFTDSVPRVLFSHSEGIVWKQGASSGYLVKEVCKATKSVIETAQRHLVYRAGNESIPKKLSDIEFSLSSPWIISTAKNITLNFERDQELTQKYIEQLIEEERVKSAKEQSEELQVIEQKIFDVKINGYSVLSWDNKKAKEVTVSFIVSAAGSKLIAKFNDLAKHYTRHGGVHFHSSLLLQQIGMRIISPQEIDYVFAFIHGELTDIATIESDSCSRFGSFPFGCNSFVRKMAKSTRNDLHAADSMLKLYCSNHLEDEHHVSTYAVVDQISAGWISDFKKSSNIDTALTYGGVFIVSALMHEDLYVHSLKSAFPKSLVKTISIDEANKYLQFEPNSSRRPCHVLAVLAIHNLRQS